MHQLTTYAATTGLRISPMEITTHFYPLGIDEKYIVIVASSGAESRNYSYYDIVLNMLRPLLKRLNLKMIQCGGKDDKRLQTDIDTCGKTTIYQYSHLISNAELVLCADTSALHIAGHFNKKIVTLFSVSSPKVSGAFFGDKEQQIYLTPEGSWTPSFFPNEIPKTINLIKPERVAQAVAKLLKIEIAETESLFIGQNYGLKIIETIPNHLLAPNVFSDSVFNIRYDKGGTEEGLFQQLLVRPATIVTNKPIDIDKLNKLKPRCQGVIYIVPQEDCPDFANNVNKLGIPLKLVSFLPLEELNTKKLNYVDFGFIEDGKKPTKESLEVKNCFGAQFSTNRLIFSNRKAFLSYAHEKIDKPIDNLNQNTDDVIDDTLFWEDSDFYYIFNAK